jgi:L-ascorbate oxidase
VSATRMRVTVRVTPAALVLGLLVAPLTWSAELREPLTLRSERGVLDLLMVARPAPIPTLAPFAPVGWVYEICRRPSEDAEACPDASPDTNYYGGTRLALNPGDTLKVHLVNKLPPAVNAIHAAEPGQAFLTLNPTNIHTHGLLVSPHGPTADDPTYGDNVFVLTFNPQNGTPEVSPHMHSAVRLGSTDYTIRIPANHPAGLFWFHPHAHGLAVNQISAGLAGIITIGSVSDYVCSTSNCFRSATTVPVRHLILKDTQVLPDGSLQDQEHSDFCIPSGGVPATGSLGAGGCPGQDRQSGQRDYRGGRWFFTLNGQPAPTMTVRSSIGEIWRLTNASASVTYDLSLHDTASNRDLVLQVISLDGVSVAPTRNLAQDELVQVLGGKLQLVRCPGIEPGRHRERIAEPLCVTRLHMMPSTRAELWVTYRGADDRPTNPVEARTAVFRTNGVSTGPYGDNWPAVDLATVRFVGYPTRRVRPWAVPEFLGVGGDAARLMVPSALSGDLYGSNTAIGFDPNCRPLPAGHRRRIFFNVSTSTIGYGLGYEEIDARGQPVPGTFQDVAPFDPMRPTVCLPLGPGNTSVKEVWELVNLEGEDHNFHVHQAHLRLISTAEVEGTGLPTRVLGDGVMMDGVPLEHADGTCLTVADWRNGICRAHPATVEIPFAIAGDFVYHCHILKHEDYGMMARIRVRPNP